MVRGSASGSHLMRLVTTEADAFAQKYVDMLTGDSSWLREIATMSALAEAASVQEADVLEIFVALALYHAASLHRRIVQPTKRRAWASQYVLGCSDIVYLFQLSRSAAQPSAFSTNSGARR
eukprot:218908-Alexandrium_andersonii.AAC.1